MSCKNTQEIYKYWYLITNRKVSSSPNPTDTLNYNPNCFYPRVHYIKNCIVYFQILNTIKVQSIFKFHVCYHENHIRRDNRIAFSNYMNLNIKLKLKK